MGWQIHVCDVHRLVDKDVIGRECMYCPKCSAWICKDCRGNWTKRGHAMMLAKMEALRFLQEGRKLER